MLRSKFVKFFMSIFKRQVDSSPNFVSFFSQEILFLGTFLAQAVYTLLIKNPLKWKFSRLSSVQVKFCQIPCANFETTSRFLSKFCTLLQFHEWLLLCTFFSSNNIYFAHKEPIKIHHGSTSCWCLYFTFPLKVLAPRFHYSLGSCLYLFLLYILLSQSW